MRYWGYPEQALNAPDENAQIAQIAQFKASHKEVLLTQQISAVHTQTMPIIIEKIPIPPIINFYSVARAGPIWPRFIMSAVAKPRFKIMPSAFVRPPRETMPSPSTVQSDAADSSNAPIALSPILVSAISPPPQKRLDIYAYSFLRSGSDKTGTLAPAPQYGGGQSGAIITYKMTRHAALIGRVSLAHKGSNPAEFAAGLRIKPVQSIPISFTAERRFRANSPDVTALYAAGSREDMKLPAGLSARAYAQAGVIFGPQSGHFYDTGIRIDRPVIKVADTLINVGIGSWAGGQRAGNDPSAGRIDIGPALRTKVNLGPAPLHISADWRFRVAGNAQPKNGPAITISTGF